MHRTKEGLFAIEHLQDSQDPAVQSAIYTSFSQFEELVAQLDKGNKSTALVDLKLTESPLVQMALQSISAIKEQSASIIFDRYGVQGVSLTNLEELYNPMFTGIFSMQDNRRNLIKHGMTAQFADQLAKRYIDKFTPHELLGDKGLICSIMDLFNSKNSGSKAITKLLKANFEQVTLNYVTWEEYKQTLHQNRVQELLERSNFFRQGVDSEVTRNLLKS